MNPIGSWNASAGAGAALDIAWFVVSDTVFILLFFRLFTVRYRFDKIYPTISKMVALIYTHRQQRVITSNEFSSHLAVPNANLTRE